MSTAVSEVHRAQRAFIAEREKRRLAAASGAAVAGFMYRAESLPMQLRESLLTYAAPSDEVHERQSWLLEPKDYDGTVLQLLATCVHTGLLASPCDSVQFLVHPPVSSSTHALTRLEPADGHHLWGPRIVFIGLGASVEFLLRRRGVTVRQLLTSGGACVLRGPARHDWSCGIARGGFGGGSHVDIVLRSTRLFALATKRLGFDDDQLCWQAMVVIADADAAAEVVFAASLVLQLRAATGVDDAEEDSVGNRLVL
jgi:hypothetical protein